MLVLNEQNELKNTKKGTMMGGKTPNTGRCPIPGTVQGQAGWHSEHPGLVEVSLPMARVLALDDL